MTSTRGQVQGHGADAVAPSDSRLVRPVPVARLSAAAAVLASCPRVIGSRSRSYGRRSLWELVDPAADVTEFASAVAATATHGDGRVVRLAALAVSEPDQVSTATQLVRALTGELVRGGAETVEVVAADRVAVGVLSACGFVPFDRSGLLMPSATAWRYRPA